LAEGAWRSSSEVTVQSAGIAPAEEVHPAAMAAARNAGISLAGQRPKGFSDVSGDPDLVVTVCDITGEGEIPFRGSRLHWSIPDPVGSDDPEAFDGALREIEIRVRSLVEHIEGERR
jgi:protein-tyrosine-phosphatase